MKPLSAKASGLQEQLLGQLSNLLMEKVRKMLMMTIVTIVLMNLRLSHPRWFEEKNSWLSLGHKNTIRRGPHTCFWFSFITPFYPPTLILYFQNIWDKYLQAYFYKLQSHELLYYWSFIKSRVCAWRKAHKGLPFSPSSTLPTLRTTSTGTGILHKVLSRGANKGWKKNIKHLSFTLRDLDKIVCKYVQCPWTLSSHFRCTRPEVHYCKPCAFQKSSTQVKYGAMFFWIYLHWRRKTHNKECPQ